MKNCHSFFANKECEFYPCHENITGDLNCLFCYCPLYSMGDKCGGNFTMLSNGIKDCSGCTIPHSEKGYDYIMKKLQDNR
ncbi:MAG: cysteine-rich small domain-containing protein [Clostridia bacterium]|nr:cysteine-rich small domain-containing protein [Clostridia bacterium]